jgi:spore coat polysaccharide biosynthesis predicted glycosyltransferase SpsG
MNALPPGRIAIRADGGGRIGLGHVMRCAALAAALDRAGHRALFITATPEILPPGLEGAADIRILDAAETAARLTGYLLRSDVSLLVGDWKHVDPALVAAVRAAGIVTVLLGGQTGEATPDLLIRQSLAQTPPPPEVTTLDGPDYLLLDHAYSGLPPRAVRPVARQVLVSLGGTDTPVIARIESVLDALANECGIQADIRRPAGGPVLLPLLHAALKDADIGILAGGTTLHEAAATGLPVICVPIAENQDVRAGQVEPLGLGLRIDPDTHFETRLADALRALIPDAGRRSAMARTGQALVDAKGADRVARDLLERRLPRRTSWQ